MYGIKTRANDVEQIRWIDGDEMVVRLSAVLAAQITLNELSKFEGGFDVVEETNSKYVAKGHRTGFEFSVEVIKVGA